MNYVAGYAWYHWFSDAHIVEGNPLEPTNLGLEYIGTLENGSVFDFGSTSLGSYIAYLSGGELTHNVTGGDVNFISALSGQSTISGSVDWNLDGWNWVRIKPGAGLSKNGTCNITCSSTTFTNEGTFEMLEGYMLFDYCDFSGLGLMRIESGATADFLDSRRVTIEHDIELDGGTLSTDVAGGFIIASGANLYGEGTVEGSIQFRGRHRCPCRSVWSGHLGESGRDR